MKTKFYVDNQGNYIGGFAGAEPPEGSIEVPSAPDNVSDKWVDGGWVKDTAQIVSFYDTATQSRLDEFAQKRGYRDMIFCIGYEKSTVTQWASDALKMIKARDDTWTKAIDIMQDVQNGEITLPTLDEYLSMLPVLAWD